ncbi:MAG: PadR family transcriptional regulator, partial [Halalkalicoccus sp.]
MRKSGPPKGLIAYLVLELLDEKPRYGSEILKESAEASGGRWDPSSGPAGRTPYSLEEEGWAERIEREDEPDRKYFELTDAGRGKLREKRESTAETGREFADVILGFYHVYVALATDDRFDLPEVEGQWRFDETFSAWIAEQVIRHYERDFGEFERIEETPEEFAQRYGLGEEPVR